MERNNYRLLHKRIRKLESQLIPILSTPLNPEITPSQHPVLQTFHHTLNYMNNLVSAELASSPDPQRLTNIVKRVIRLQRAVHTWTEGRHVESGGSDRGSLIESCVTDDDVGCEYKGEGSGLVGFKVYENPLFDGIVVSDDGYDDDADNDDSDNDDNSVGIIDEYEVGENEGGEEEDLIRVIDQGEEHESEAGNEGMEKEVIKVDYQKEDAKKQEEKEKADDEDEDEDEEEDGTQNCGYKILFWSLIIVMVVILVRVILSNFPDNHAPVMLTPT